MDLARQLKQSMVSGSVLFGQRQTMSACTKGDARLVIVAANCPVNYVSELTESHPDVPVHQVLMVTSQLGAACAMPFPICDRCVLAPGQSELLSLSPNV